MHPRRSPPRSPNSLAVRNPRAGIALSSLRPRSTARYWRVYSLDMTVSLEWFAAEQGRVIDAVAPLPCPSLEMSTLPPLASTKIDAIQKPRPDPGTAARWRWLRNDFRPRFGRSSGVIPTP